MQKDVPIYGGNVQEFFEKKATQEFMIWPLATLEKKS